MDYTITIQNNTGDANQAFRYIAFGFPHGTHATQGGVGLPVVFYQSRLLNDGEPVTFNISSTVFGFLGNASQINTDLTAGANISLTKALPVNLGGRAGDGTELEAKPRTGGGVDFKTADSRLSPPGTFSIIASSALKHKNQYAVGLARKIDGNYVPVTVFGLHPGQTFDITPIESIYIARHSTTATNTVVNADSYSLKQEVNLQPDQPKITVTDDGAPTSFKVRYNY
ncbi:hypothetical protein AYL99_09888 [Fonsecaea erecta]|uniref:Uncharacterized protein n=1 Tax=Fonsecaea erecta TaxID=1367422 RepID=A0A178Z8F8_9EURO|nr:hypothetical protein AYL99_09888 [Fonsecaea erecta]OAP55736.1 hypothetical protein AYL99_09888 [Fonsecaea erecta]